MPKPTKVLPRGDAWQFEAKLDGFRLQVVKDRRNVRLFTRRGADWTRRLPSLVDLLGALPARTAVLDTELVFLSEVADSSQYGPLLFGLDRVQDGLNVFAFDLLHLNGTDQCRQSLLERRKKLAALFEKCDIPCLHLVAAFEDGAELFRVVEDLGLEGVVAKRKDRPYMSGVSSDWLKMKTSTWRQDNRWKLEHFERSK